MRYYITTKKIPSMYGPGYSDNLEVSIHQEDDAGVDTVVGSYKRNYSCMYNTFHPFQKGDKWFALYSKDYETSSVMALPSCEHLGDGPKGFCPVDFYVPQAKDLNPDGSMTENEESAGTFGFVAGCVWGDDAGGWKAEFLDLSKIEEGVLSQDGRMGYFELPLNYKELKDCFIVGDYHDEGYFYVNTTFRCNKGMNGYVPDRIEYSKVGDPEPSYEELRAMEEIPNKVLFKKLESVKDSYHRQDTSYHNLLVGIRRKYGDEVAKEMDQDARPFSSTPVPEDLQKIINSEIPNPGKYARCNSCHKATPVDQIKDHLVKHFYGGRILYTCPDCGKTVISKIYG